MYKPTKIRIEASNGKHTFTFEAPSAQHESIQALESIGYTCRTIARVVLLNVTDRASGESGPTPVWVAP